MVAFLSMLLAIGAGTQAAMMEPTEMRAFQHFNSISRFAEQLGLTTARLTGSTKKSERRIIFEALENGSLNLIIGTHALLENRVKVKKLGLAVIDEQHRFGVAQRARLWQKNESIPPHILVMTATPIPRTLAMTLYGDLDVSTIDELPRGRKEIKTFHYSESRRLQLFGFIKKEVQAGRQCYIVYPLIEESKNMDYKDLMDGYESICRAFPDIPISILHGKMKPDDKAFEMDRFSSGQTKILVSTTVIEVGVDVPNASVMVIENAEKFGLAQLHQLRGRVGRGHEQSYCILMTSHKLSQDARTRIETMVRTNNGFEVADVDLSLRGPGEITGTRQSGSLELKIANLAEDGKILQLARTEAKKTLTEDASLDSPKNQMMKQHLKQISNEILPWERIS
jgi:ATP-dependent DNA helicase RecG